MINYDWKDAGSREYLEKEFIGFQFHGEGWYDNGTDAVFVRLRHKADTWSPATYDLYCWNNQTVSEVRGKLSQVITSPVHILSTPKDK